MNSQNTGNGKYSAQFNKQGGNEEVEGKKETEEIEQEKDRNRELQTNQLNLSSWKNTGTNNQTVSKHLEDNKKDEQQPTGICQEQIVSNQSNFLL